MHGGGPNAILLSQRGSEFKLGRSKSTVRWGGPELIVRCSVLLFLGNVQINPDVTRRTLHDKGENAALESEFPNSPLNASCRHLIPNMRDARVYDKYMWLQVTKVLTREERDEAWSKLQKVAPQQARWLQDSLLPHQWQQRMAASWLANSGL